MCRMAPLVMVGTSQLALEKGNIYSVDPGVFRGEVEQMNSRNREVALSQDPVG